MLQKACTDLVSGNMAEANYQAIVTSEELTNAEVVGYLLAAAAIDPRIDPCINREPFSKSAPAMRLAVDAVRNAIVDDSDLSNSPIRNTWAEPPMGPG